MDDFKHGELAIRFQRRTAPPSCELTWSGRGIDQKPRTVLAPYFDSVLKDAAASGSAIEMRFDQLEQVNSSTISAIMQILQDAKGRRVPVVVIYDPGRRWQKLSFEALRVLITDDGLLELRNV